MFKNQTEKYVKSHVILQCFRPALSQIPIGASVTMVLVGCFGFI